MPIRLAGHCTGGVGEIRTHGGFYPLNVSNVARSATLPRLQLFFILAVLAPMMVELLLLPLLNSQIDLRER